MILTIGCLVRLVGIGEVPVGLNADEAYAGYEAWAIANEGADSHGYTNPVYFVSWGSGMNVLYSYLSVPAVKMFGLNVFSLRITQVVFGCLTIVLIYLIARRFLDRKKSLVLFALLAICPWHVMLSRWGLESDILPFCLTLGVFGFVYGLKKKPLLLFSALGFGLSLYSYAVAWAVVPFLLALLIVYGIRTKQLMLNRWSMLAGCLLVLLGLPLLLFLLVNAGILPEIRTAVFSVPKMPVFGSGGYSLDVPTHLVNFVNVVLNLKPDGYNAIPGFGLFFLFSSPLVVYGLWHVGKKSLASWRSRSWSLEVVCVFWILAYIPVVLFIEDANATRINGVLMPVFIVMAIGLLHLAREGFGRRVLPVVMAAYAVSFLGFWQAYQENRAWNFPESYGPIAYTNEIPGNVYFDGINFAEVLVAAKPTIGSREAIQDNPDAADKGGRIDIRAIGRYKLTAEASDPIDNSGCYVINSNNYDFAGKLESAGFRVVFENPSKKVWRKP